MNVLVVINPFGGFENGHRITDPNEIEAVLAGEHAHDVVQSDHKIEASATTSEEA